MDEARYHEQQHRQWLDEQRTYGAFSDMDVLRQLSMERGEKERREKEAEQSDEPPPP